VLEFNARFGDPEAQVLLPLLDEPLAELLIAAARGALPAGIATARGAAVGVVAAAAGYPGDTRVGDTITGIDTLDPDVLCFQAGTRRASDGTLRTAAGRVLAVVACHDSSAVARERAYRNLDRIHFAGMHARRGIATQVVVPA